MSVPFDERQGDFMASESKGLRPQGDDTIDGSQVQATATDDDEIAMGAVGCHDTAVGQSGNATEERSHVLKSSLTGIRRGRFGT